MPAIAVAAMVTEAAVLIVFGGLLLGALREVGLIRLRLGPHPGALITDDGLPVGSTFPDASVAPLNGAIPVSLFAGYDQPLVLAFLSSSCQACTDLVPHLDEIASTSSGFRFAVVLTTSGAAASAFAQDTGLRTAAFVVDAADATQIYKLPGTPFVYIVGSDRKVLNRGVANDWIGLESMITGDGSLQAGRSWVPVAGDRSLAAQQ